MMTKLLSDGLLVTAVHNHLLGATPPTFYVWGQGDPVKLAHRCGMALLLS